MGGGWIDECSVGRVTMFCSKVIFCRRFSPACVCSDSDSDSDDDGKPPKRPVAKPAAAKPAAAAAPVDPAAAALAAKKRAAALGTDTPAAASAADAGPPKLSNMEIKKLNGDALKDHLKARNLDVQGQKKDLMKRLSDYEAARA
jgi:hypothetical protein